MRRISKSLFAFRYLFARKSHNVINLISGISVAGMAIGTAALIIILSVFNGFNQLVSESLGDAQPDLIVKPATGKAFVPDSTTFAWLYDQDMVFNMSSVIEEQAFISFDGKQSLARVKGVDSVFEEESPIQNHITDGVFSLHRGTGAGAVIGSSLAWSMEINPRFVAPLEIYYPDREGAVSLANPTSSLRSATARVNGIFALNSELDAARIVARKDAGLQSVYLGSLEVPLTQIQNMPALLGEADVIKSLQLLPGVHDSDGFFMARLKRSTE